MNIQTLDFTDIDKLTVTYPDKSTDDPDTIRVGTNGTQLYRNRTDFNSNNLDNATLVALGSTTLSGATKATDWDNGKVSYLNEGSGSQQVKISLGTGQEFFLKQLRVICVLASNDTLSSIVTLEISDDDTNFTKLQLEIDENVIIATTDIDVGLHTKYLRFTFNGTTLDANNLIIADIIAYRSVYENPYVTLEHTDTWKTNAFDGITVTANEPVGTSIQYQILKNGLPYYYDSDQSDWVQTTKDPDYDYVNSSTATIINTNKATFPLTITDTVNLGIRAIMISDKDTTPAITSVVFD